MESGGCIGKHVMRSVKSGGGGEVVRCGRVVATGKKKKGGTYHE